MHDVRVIATTGNAVGAVVVAIMVVGSFGLLGTILTIRQRRRRAADRAERVTEMGAWARARGWGFTAEDPALAAGATPGCFELEHPAKANHLWARDVAQGTLAYPSLRPAQVLEWERTRYVQTYNPNGGSFTTTAHDFCASTRVSLPGGASTLAVVPRGTPDRSKRSDAASSGEPITGDGAFDSAYRIVVPDAAGLAVLTPQVLQWQAGQATGTGWQITDTTLEVWAYGHLSPAVADDLLAGATSLLQLLPASIAGTAP